ncbi:hypothetical protein D1AOALGA4SA_11693 [Olavius algarvensis Delta 1 endosymbiont]|nr:hypothetical protein D1AOALGA4SA_11693 [Olavius algarvensis Delta 1 endosymbiont]
MSQFKSHSVNLHILSPIHIGTGQEMDPFSYVIKGGEIKIFDLTSWLEHFPAKAELYQRMDSEDFVALRAYIAENFDVDSAVLNTIPVESTDVLETYRKAILDKASQHQALINFMTRNELSRIPYIPGSSIKGAIRTAVASGMVRAAGVTSKDSYRSRYNQKIFGPPTDDPMKNLKVPDVSLDKFGSAVYEAKEHSFKKSPTPKGAYEAAVGLLQQLAPVVYPSRISLKPFSLKGKTADLKFIVDAAYNFYIPKFKEEFKKFYSGKNAEHIQQAIAPLNDVARKLKANETLIRIGHFSHVECVTLDGIRQPLTRKGKDGKPLPWGVTRTLANGIYPFGWVKLEFLDLPPAERGQSEWPFSLQAVTTQIEEIKRIKLREEAAAETKKQREEEETRKLEADIKRKAELEAMTPEERVVAEVKDPAVTENRVVEIYNMLNDFSEDYQNKLALALKDYWASHEKWTKKQCTKKQWAKVQKVKSILGNE